MITFGTQSKPPGVGLILLPRTFKLPLLPLNRFLSSLSQHSRKLRSLGAFSCKIHFLKFHLTGFLKFKWSNLNIPPYHLCMFSMLVTIYTIINFKNWQSTYHLLHILLRTRNKEWPWRTTRTKTLSQEPTSLCLETKRRSMLYYQGTVQRRVSVHAWM